MDDNLTHWGRDKNGLNFAVVIFKLLFLNENLYILIQISPKVITKGSLDSMSALDQMLAWWQKGDEPLSEPIMG